MGQRLYDDDDDGDVFQRRLERSINVQSHPSIDSRVEFSKDLFIQ